MTSANPACERRLEDDFLQDSKNWNSSSGQKCGRVKCPISVSTRASIFETSTLRLKSVSSPRGKKGRAH